MQQQVTTKSWLIANFEICAFAAASIAGFILIAFSSAFQSETIFHAEKFWDSFGIGEFILLAVITAQIKERNHLVGIAKYIGILICIGAGFYLLSNGDGSESKLITKLIVVTIAIFIVSNTLASRLTKFASSHFDEVLSVRVLFKSSNTEIYTMKAKYLIDRFTNITASITIATAWLVICTFFPTVFVR